MIIDGLIDKLSPSVYSRELKKLLQMSLSLFNHGQNCMRSLCQLYVQFPEENTNKMKQV